MATEIEIYRMIEEIFESYGGRQIQRITGHSNMEVEEIYQLRGKCQATKELITDLRTALAYDTDGI
jgi:hypothetical protein